MILRFKATEHGIIRHNANADIFRIDQYQDLWFQFGTTISHLNTGSVIPDIIITLLQRYRNVLENDRNKSYLILYDVVKHYYDVPLY